MRIRTLYSRISCNNRMYSNRVPASLARYHTCCNLWETLAYCISPLYYSKIIIGSSLAVFFLVQYPQTWQYWNSPKQSFFSSELHSGHFFNNPVFLPPSLQLFPAFLRIFQILISNQTYIALKPHNHCQIYIYNLNRL